MELIKVKNGISILDPRISYKIAQFEIQMKRIKEAQDNLKKMIKEEMESKNIVKIENDDLTIVYIEKSYRESFDAKALQKEDEETYNKYIKISPVNASIRMRVKKE